MLVLRTLQTNRRLEYRVNVSNPHGMSCRMKMENVKGRPSARTGIVVSSSLPVFEYEIVVSNGVKLDPAKLWPRRNEDISPQPVTWQLISFDWTQPVLND